MNILLVEDDPETLRLLLKSLQLAFPTFTLETAASAEDAEEVIAGGFVPRLVVSDVRLPGRSGVDLLVGLQQRFPEVQFILTSGFAPPELPRQADGEKVLRFLAKPFEISQLVAAVQDVFMSDQFSGVHQAITFIDILQVLNMAQRTALVQLLRDEQPVGELYMVDGELRHASSGALEGEEAFLALAAAPETPFRVRAGELPPRHTVHRAFGTLLIDVMSDED